MKIKDFDRNFIHHLSCLPQTKSFIENYTVPDLDMDLQSINVALSNIVLDNLNSLDQKLLTGNNYAWNDKISFSTGKISKISKSLSLVKVGEKPASLKEYYFWKNISSASSPNDGSLEKIDVLSDYLRNHCWDYSSGSYTINDESIKDLLLNLILHINDLGESTPNHSSIEQIKAYLYPAVDSNIDFLSILKELEKDPNDVALYRLWKRSALKYSSDPKLFKYLFNKIKRSSGYVQKKMSIIRTAFSNNAVDKDLFKLFIKKSTITIRRELADTFATTSSYVLRNSDIIQSMKKHLETPSDSRNEKYNIRDRYQRLESYLGGKLSLISYENFIMESDQDKILYLDQLQDALNEEYNLAQSGLIYISEEKDYNVQRNVVDYISKENSVWVLPNITDSYCRRILNNKIIGE